MLVRTQLSLEGSPFSMNVLSATEWPVGSMTETPLYRDKALRGRAQWCYLWGGACPGASQGRAQAAPGKDPPGRCLFLCYLFSPAIFEAFSLLHAEHFQRLPPRFPPTPPLSVDLLLRLVFCFVLVEFFLIK